MTSRWNDEPVRRTTPPAQPPGWVDPPEREPVKSVPDWWGWESVRDRWDEAGKDPITHRQALIGAAVCGLIIALIVAYFAAARPVEGGEPASEVGTALYTASATWCAPTPTHCQGWGGNARLAAVNSFTWGDEPYWVRITRDNASVDALVVSHCACRGEDGYIDVSPAVFEQLAPLELGRIDVVVEVLIPDQHPEDPPEHPDDARLRIEDGGPTPTLPPTDTLGTVQ